MLYDVAVIGSGPAGCMATLTLRGLGYNTLLIAPGLEEQQMVPAIGEHLTPSAKDLLAAMGIGGKELAGCAIESHGIQSAWFSREPVLKSFLYSPYGCGLSLNRGRFNRILLDKAMAVSDCALIGQGVRRITCASAGVFELLLDGAETDVRHVRHLVDASGRNPLSARFLGARVEEIDDLWAIATWYRPEEPLPAGSSGLLLEATETGWWYSLALPRNRYLAVLITDRTQVTAYRNQPARYLAAALQRAPQTAARNRSVGTPVARYVLKAGPQFLVPACGENWFAVGDAAYARDPLSGRGIAEALAQSQKACRWFHDLSDDSQRFSERYASELAHVRQSDTERRNAVYGDVAARWPEAAFWRERTG